MEKGIYTSEELFEYLFMVNKRSGEELSPSEVHQILYIATHLYLRDTGKYLIKEDFEAWVYGPKLRNLQEKFRGLPTFSPLKEDDYGFYGIALTHSEDYLEEIIDSNAKQALLEASNILENLTLEEKSNVILNTYPWRKTYKEGEILTIHKSLFKKDFDKKVYLKKEVQKAMTKEELDKAHRFKEKVLGLYKDSTLNWVKNRYPKEDLEERLLTKAHNGETHMFIGPIPKRIDIDTVVNYIQTVFPLFTVEESPKEYITGVVSDGFVKVTFIEDPHNLEN